MALGLRRVGRAVLGELGELAAPQVLGEVERVQAEHAEQLLDARRLGRVGHDAARSAADALKNSGASSKPQLVYPPMNEWTVPCGKYGMSHAQS